MNTLDNRTQANAAWMEHQILEHVKQALRVTLGWRVPAEGVSRKLSSVQFTLKSFQRHLERLMEIEEQDGYMEFVSETKPNLQFRVDQLERDHARFRRSVDRLIPKLESINEYQGEQFETVCDEISSLLERVDCHDAAEIELLQETLLFDEGGEG